MKAISVVAAFGLVVAVPPVLAQKVVLPRAKEPVLLCGFKAPDAASR